jgi:hypothetical protein
MVKRKRFSRRVRTAGNPTRGFRYGRPGSCRQLDSKDPKLYRGTEWERFVVLVGIIYAVLGAWIQCTFTLILHFSAVLAVVAVVALSVLALVVTRRALSLD